MKKTDVAMLVLIAALSAFVTYVVVAATPIGKSTTQSVKVKTIDPISSSLASPDSRVFNSSAINPSVKVNIDKTASSANQSSSDQTNSGSDSGSDSDTSTNQANGQ